jgi:hypothetical protein
MIINEEVYRESTDYLFDKLIPRIQSHVNKTGHVWNLNSSCHECLSVRQDYKDKIFLIKLYELENKGCDSEDAIHSIKTELAFNREFCQRLSE